MNYYNTLLKKKTHLQYIPNYNKLNNTILTINLQYVSDIINCIQQNADLSLSWVLCPLWLVFLCTVILANFHIPVSTPKWPLCINLLGALVARLSGQWNNEIISCNNYWRISHEFQKSNLISDYLYYSNKFLWLL